MLRPHVPVNPLPTGSPIPLLKRNPVDSEIEPVNSTPAPVAAPRTTVQLTPGSALALAAGGGAVVLVVGAVLVSMLLAVAITGVSVAVCAVVLKSLLNQERKH
ncbi:SpdD-like protein [Streptomyces tanashiensis]